MFYIRSNNNGELLDNGNYEIGNICGYNIEIQYFKSNPVGVLYKRLGFIQNGESKFHYKMIKPKIESSNLIF